MLRNPQPFPDEPPQVQPLRSRWRLSRRQGFSLLFLLLFLLSGIIGGWTAISIVFHSQAAPSASKFTLQQFLKQGHPYLNGQQVIPGRSNAFSDWKNLP